MSGLAPPLAVVSSSLNTSLARYGRSLGLWVMLLVAPVAARFMVAGRGAHAATISLNGRVPWLTSPVMGMTLGVVIATLLLPVAFIYLRSNATKRQPWQVEEVAPAPRLAIVYGRWLADVTALAAILAATTAAGIFLALMMMPLAEVNPLLIVFTVWVIAGPPLVMVASLRIVFDAWSWTRGWFGEFLFFWLWMGSLILVMLGDHATGFASEAFDLPGFMSPIMHGQPPGMDFTIGGGAITKGAAPVLLDVMGGVLAPGYLPSRLMWLALAAALPLLAAAVYGPHVTGKTRKPIGWLRWLQPGKARPADPNAKAARPAASSWLGLIGAEAALIANARAMKIAMVVMAVAGWFGPYSRVAGPGSMLLLLFAATAHAGRSEQADLLALTRTGLMTPMMRRAAFVVAGVGLMLAMGAGAIVHGAIAGQVRPLAEAVIVGGLTSTAAIALAALTRGATAPRLVLLMAWYAYMSWGGG